MVYIIIIGALSWYKDNKDYLLENLQTAIENSKKVRRKLNIKISDLDFSNRDNFVRF